MKKQKSFKKVIYIIGITKKHKEILEGISKNLKNFIINSYREELKDIIFQINGNKNNYDIEETTVFVVPLKELKSMKYYYCYLFPKIMVNMSWLIDSIKSKELIKIDNYYLKSPDIIKKQNYNLPFTFESSIFI